jgi:uncharacterized protein
LIIYVDSSVLARAYLSDEIGHAEVRAMFDDPELSLITGTWTRIEVSGAIVRAARSGRADVGALLAWLDAELGPDGPVTVVGAPQDEVENRSLELVRLHGLRAMDAWHLSVAALLTPSLVEPGEDTGFATRDPAQGTVAMALGLTLV